MKFMKNGRFDEIIHLLQLTIVILTDHPHQPATNEFDVAKVFCVSLPLLLGHLRFPQLRFRSIPRHFHRIVIGWNHDAEKKYPGSMSPNSWRGWPNSLAVVVTRSPFSARYGSDAPLFSTPLTFFVLFTLFGVTIRTSFRFRLFSNAESKLSD